jgi:glycosyltransferase involved in cell wall biosynthesis
MQPETVLFLGQLPPPWHGQARINAMLAGARFSTFRLATRPMAESRNIDEVGRFSPTKGARLIGAWVRLVAAVARRRPVPVLYSVGVVGRSAVYRDAVLLGTLRLLRQRVVLHVHTAGLDQLFAGWHPFEQRIARAAYRAAGIIRLTSGIGQLDGFHFPYEALLPSGVDDTTYVRSPERAPSTPVKVAFVGNFYTAKGVSTLLEACRRLSGSSTPIEVDFIGGAADGRSLDDWIHDAERLGVADLVTFHGARPSDDVAQALAAADIFCSPSENDAMPIAIIEAMRAGLPVVATRLGAIPNLVEDGVNGLLVEPRDVTATANALGHIVSDQATFATMCRNARERYCSHHTQSAFLQSFEKIMNEFLGPRRSRGSCTRFVGSGPAKFVSAPPGGRRTNARLRFRERVHGHDDPLDHDTDVRSA